MPIELQIEEAPPIVVDLTIIEPIELVAKSGTLEMSPSGRGIVSITGDGEGNVEVLFTDATTESVNVLATGLDNKADTDHNHSLNNLSEKSYNSLTETPDLSSLHNHTNKIDLDNYDPENFALADHDHDSVYSDVNHNHSGLYEPADATILKDADIGINVAAQGHNHDNAYSALNHNHSGTYLESESDPVFTQSDAAGISSTDISNWNGKAEGSHNHDSVYSAIGHNHSGAYEPIKGEDDNYVTNEEKIKLSNLSGENTGDQDLSGYSLTNHNHSNVYEPANANIQSHISDTTTVHVATGEKATWNGKQDALGYTPENVSNKKTTLTDSDTDYPTTRAVNTGLSGYALSNHAHSGTYEPADSTILKDADIGVSIAAQNHNHSGTYEPADATILKDADIGVTVSAQGHNHTGTYEPADATILKDVDINVSLMPFQIALDTKEPTGFDVAIAWGLATVETVVIDTNTKLRITINATGSIVWYWQGIKHTVSSPIVVTSTENKSEGIWYLYSTDGTNFVLTKTAFYINNLVNGSLRNDLMLWEFYWDNTNNTTLWIQPEFHGFTMSGRDHYDKHEAFGTRFVSGLAVTYGVVPATANTDKRIKLSSGEIHDEDISCYINHSATPTAIWQQNLGSVGTADANYAQLPIYYRSGADTDKIWRKLTATSYPFTPITNNVDFYYNRLNAGTWDYTTATANNNYWKAFVVATTNQSEPVVVIAGRTASSSLATIQNEGLPDLAGEGLFTEYKLLYELIYRNATTTAGKATLISVTDKRKDSISNNAGITLNISAAQVVVTPSGNITSTNAGAALVELDTIKEPAFSKKTAFNKDFGTALGEVAQGNHTHSDYALTSHNHNYIKKWIGESLDNSFTEIIIDNVLPPAIPKLFMNDNTLLFCRIDVVGIDSNENHGVFNIEATAKKKLASESIVLMQWNYKIISLDNENWAVRLVADTSDGSLKLEVLGAENETTKWSALGIITEVSM